MIRYTVRSKTSTKSRAFIIPGLVHWSVHTAHQTAGSHRLPIAVYQLRTNHHAWSCVLKTHKLFFELSTLRKSVHFLKNLLYKSKLFWQLQSSRKIMLTQIKQRINRHKIKRNIAQKDLYSTPFPSLNSAALSIISEAIQNK